MNFDDYWYSNYKWFDSKVSKLSIFGHTNKKTTRRKR